jgi:Domain of unknown function (DUF4411)
MIDSATLFLLDASVLIDANNLYYPVNAVPEYWEWLAHMGTQGRIKMPFEIFEEVKDGPKDEHKDLLFAWLQNEANKNALLLLEKVDSSLLQKVISEGYAPDLNDDEVEQIGRDPFLVAYGKVKIDRCIVTVEKSKPKKLRQNRKLPDVCKGLGVQCCNPFEFNRALGFTTNWKEAMST